MHIGGEGGDKRGAYPQNVHNPYTYLYPLEFGKYFMDPPRGFLSHVHYPSMALADILDFSTFQY
jgi:hypothetical protein